MSRLSLLGLLFVLGVAVADEPAKAKVDIGKPAPDFKFTDQSGKTIRLADLFAQGPVLVRLTCGCSGCDKELAYFQEIDAAYNAAMQAPTPEVTAEPTPEVTPEAAPENGGES